MTKDICAILSESAGNTYLLMHSGVDRLDARRCAMERHLRQLMEAGQYNPATCEPPSWCICEGSVRSTARSFSCSVHDNSGGACVCSCHLWRRPTKFSEQTRRPLLVERHASNFAGRSSADPRERRRGERRRAHRRRAVFTNLCPTAYRTSERSARVTKRPLEADRKIGQLERSWARAGTFRPARRRLDSLVL